jgi:hypothetical protein
MKTKHLAIALVIIPLMVLAHSLVEQNSQNSSKNTTLTSSLHYNLEWDISPVEVPVWAWQFENDLGYEINLKELYLSSYSAQLVQCEESAHTHTSRIIPENLLAVPTAFAGHGDLLENSTRTTEPFLEALKTSSTDYSTKTDWSSLYNLDMNSYCKVHYLIGPVLETSTNLQANPDMLGQTLQLSGHFRHVDILNGEWTDFSLSSDQADGILIDLPNFAEQHEEDPSIYYEISLNRELQTLFNDIDFPNTTEEEMATIILRNLTENTTVNWRNRTIEMLLIDSLNE